MKRWLSAAVAVLVTVALVWLGAGFSGDEPATVPAAAAADDDDAEGTEEPSDRGREASAGHGPPAWAEGAGGGDAPGHDRAWHEAWKAMTPTQREQTMARFAEEHASGMRAWAQCVSEGRDDCEKPLPPGMAKKQLRP